MSIMFVGFLSISVTAHPAAPCLQADAQHARTAHIDSSFAVTGAGGTRRSDGTQMLVWTGADCVAWIQFRGPLTVNPDWQSLAASPGALFVAHDESAARRRDFSLTVTGATSFSADGKQAEMGADDREWLNGMVLEYVRRAGISAPARAREIAERAGVSGLIAESRRIFHDDVRARYLIAGFTFVDSASRSTFVGDGAALLGNAGGAADFLLAIPRSWRTDERVLVAAYAAAARIEPDDYVEQILRLMPPPRPTPASLRPLIERMIATLQNSEHRAALRAYHLDAAP
jgi:hypothetical protein